MPNSFCVWNRVTVVCENWLYTKKEDEKIWGKYGMRKAKKKTAAKYRGVVYIQNNKRMWLLWVRKHLEPICTLSIPHQRQCCGNKLSGNHHSGAKKYVGHRNIKDGKKMFHLDNAPNEYKSRVNVEKLSNYATNNCIQLRANFIFVKSIIIMLTFC